MKNELVGVTNRFVLKISKKQGWCGFRILKQSLQACRSQSPVGKYFSYAGDSAVRVPRIRKVFPEVGAQTEDTSYRRTHSLEARFSFLAYKKRGRCKICNSPFFLCVTGKYSYKTQS